jgi:hypothetical protein
MPVVSTTSWRSNCGDTYGFRGSAGDSGAGLDCGWDEVAESGPSGRGVLDALVPGEIGIIGMWLGWVKAYEPGRALRERSAATHQEAATEGSGRA